MSISVLLMICGRCLSSGIIKSYGVSCILLYLQFPSLSHLKCMRYHEHFSGLKHPPVIHKALHHFDMSSCARLPISFGGVVGSAFRNRSVSSTNIIAVSGAIRSAIADVNVDVIQNFSIIISSMILIIVHIGPAAALPCPPPCSGFSSVPS